MGMQDGKLFGWNVNARQAVGLVALVGLAYLIVSFDALVIGYVIMVVALSTFFIVVAYDIGIPKQPTPEMRDTEASDDEGLGPRSKVS
jgi:hypothetical protein